MLRDPTWLSLSLSSALGQPPQCWVVPVMVRSTSKVQPSSPGNLSSISWVFSLSTAVRSTVSLPSSLDLESFSLTSSSGMAPTSWMLSSSCSSHLGPGCHWAALLLQLSGPSLVRVRLTNSGEKERERERDTSACSRAPGPAVSAGRSVFPPRGRLRGPPSVWRPPRWPSSS